MRYGQMENMICWYWMYRCRMAPALNFARMYDKFPKCRLVKNALYHTEKGDTVHIEWRNLYSAVQIIVKDNG